MVWGQNCVLRCPKPALLVASTMTYSWVVSRPSRLSLPLRATWSLSTTASVTLFLVATRTRVKRGSRIAYCALIESEKRDGGRRSRASRGNSESVEKSGTQVNDKTVAHPRIYVLCRNPSYPSCPVARGATSAPS